jgi:hypothetical protein
MRRRRSSCPPAPAAWPTECKPYGSVRDRRSRRLLGWWARLGAAVMLLAGAAAPQALATTPTLAPPRSNTVVATIPRRLREGMILWQWPVRAVRRGCCGQHRLPGRGPLLQERGDLGEAETPPPCPKNN